MDRPTMMFGTASAALLAAARALPQGTDKSRRLSALFDPCISKYRTNSASPTSASALIIRSAVAYDKVLACTGTGMSRVSVVVG